MAARYNREHQESVIETIQSTQIVNRLQKHFNGELEKPLDATQLKAAEMLLARTMPTLSAVEQTNVNPMDSMSEQQLIQALQTLIAANPEVATQLLAQLNASRSQVDMNAEGVMH
jgi:hypothetical protein